MDIYFIRNPNKCSVLYVQAENKTLAINMVLDILKLDPNIRIILSLSYMLNIKELFASYKNTRCYMDFDERLTNTITHYYTREEKIDLLLGKKIL